MARHEPRAAEPSARLPLSSPRPRISITGFYAGFCGHAGWTEFFAAGTVTLRDAFERPAPAATPSKLGWAGAAFKRKLPEFPCLASRVLAELRGAGLWRDSALTLDPDRVATVFAASKGRLAVPLPDDYWGGTTTATCDGPALALACAVGATGPLLSPVAACATGAHSLAVGAQLIQDGYADVAVVGALENGLTPLVLAGYKSLGALSVGGLMRPFDKRRDGFVPAEGMGCLVLENAEHSATRGVPIYGYLTGWAMTADATSLTGMSPAGDSIARAIEVALKRAGQPRVDYINAHGTATRLNDIVETRGIKAVFGQRVPVSATKPLTGHLLGAAGAVEAVLCLLALRESYAPPTLNLEALDAACDLDYIPQRGRAMPIQHALSLSYGFGGHCGVLIFERPDL